MNEPPGVPSALGIEAVEWSAHAEDSLTVRVTGRWRRRRPALSGQPMLVIEAEGERHRFPAMPEPPGLTGAAPGTWQLSFTVPGALGPPALERAWLQMGAVVMPLPVATAPMPAPEADPDAESVHRREEVTDSQLLAERRLRSSELALQATRQRATQAEQRVADLAARVEELERELQLARAEPARLEELLLQRDAARRVAEQRAYAEQAMRAELQEELAQLEAEGADSDAALEELDLARARVSELESELEQLGRQADEAEQIAAAAQVARGQAQAALEEGIAAQSASAPRIPELGRRIGAEERVWDQVPGAPPTPVRAQPVEHPSSSSTLAAERRLVIQHGRVGMGPTSVEQATLAALRRELAARAVAEARLRSQLAGTAQGPSTVQRASQGLIETLVSLRSELAELRALTEGERERRRRAETRSGELERQINDYATRSAVAYEAIEGLRGELAQLRPALAVEPVDRTRPAFTQVDQRSLDEAQPPPGSPADAERTRRSLDPARLDAALVRLRESADTQAPLTPAPADATAAEPWLERAFASLADRDPAAAARLLVALLPLQGKVSPGPLDYDLVLDGIGCLQVSVGGGDRRTAVRLADTPRPAAEVQFTLSGHPARLATLVASASLRWRPGRRRPRITGDRRAASALIALVRAPSSLRELNAAGLRVDRWLALTLASLMVDVAWTRGERFSLAFQEPESAAAELYLHVRDGRRLVVSLSPLSDAPSTTIVCSADRVLALLDGDLSAGAQLRGDTRPLALVQHWIERAQSG